MVSVKIRIPACQLSARDETIYSSRVRSSPKNGFQPFNIVAPMKMPINRENKTCFVKNARIIARRGGSSDNAPKSFSSVSPSDATAGRAAKHKIKIISMMAVNLLFNINSPFSFYFIDLCKLAKKMPYKY
jgi:hypothetical protein